MSTHLCVLVIDDSMTARKWISVALRQLGGDHQVVEASDLAEAVAAVESNDVDGILVDLNMPDTDGFSICRELRERTPGVPVAIVTANVQKRIRARVAEQGYQFIAKPVTREKLSGFVRSLEKAHGEP